MKKIKAKDIEVLDEYSDLFYNKEHRKKLHKKIEKNKPLIKKVISNIKKMCNLGITFVTYGFLIANILPMGERKSQHEIEKAVELLEADDCYYHGTTIGLKENLGIKIPEIYSPFVVPYGTTAIDIVVPSNLHTNAKSAVKDSISEYNSVLNAMNKDYYFNFCENKPSHFYSIDVNLKDFPGTKVGLNSTALALFNGLRLDNKVWIDPAYQTNYSMFRNIFTHELLHSFGIGDQYLVEDQSTDTIMGISRNNQENYLQPNDIKYLFATLYDVKNQDDVNYVNAYIDYHMNAFKNPLIKNTLNETEREE